MEKPLRIYRTCNSEARIFQQLPMKWTVRGEKVNGMDYFKKGTPRLHLVGVLGGAIWSVGMSLNMIAGDAAGYAISY